MTERDEALDEFRRLLIGQHKDLPTGALSRMGRTAAAAWRARHLLRGKRPEDLKAALRLATSLGELKGVAMKMGQIMSYIDVALPEQVQATLEVLQTHAPPMPAERVRTLIRQELGEAGHHLLATLDPDPIAAASIGQVHRARLEDGTPVAVKVQYPEVARAIERDFVASGIGPAFAALVYPGSRHQVQGFIEEAKARLLEECDYEHEAQVQARFARLLADHPVLTVPAVHHHLCSPRVLTTTYLDGMDLQAWLAQDPPQAARDRVGEALFEFYVGSLFRHGLYNCDPHPGNYLLLEGGRVGLLDHGCSRSFQPGFVADLARLTLAAHDQGPDALDQVLVDMGIVAPDHPGQMDTARELVLAFYAPTREAGTGRIELPEGMGMQDILASKRELMRLDLPGAFLFLFRIRFGLMSVLERLGARADWSALEVGYAREGLAGVPGG